MTRKERLIEKLTDAKERIMSKEKWTQDAYAINDSPAVILSIVPATDSSATKWCAIGTLCKSLDIHATYFDDLPKVLTEEEEDDEDYIEPRDLEENEEDFLFLSVLLDKIACEEYGNGRDIVHVNDFFPLRRDDGEAEDELETPLAHDAVLIVYEKAIKSLREERDHV